MTRALATPLPFRPNDDYVPDGLPANRTITKAAVKDFLAQRTELVRPRTANSNDPVCVALVLDLLMRLEPSSAKVQSAAVASQLTLLYPQFHWNAVTVGKILASLSEAVKSGNPPAEDVPFRATKRNGSIVYRLSASLSSWRYLVEARRRIGAAAIESIRVERGMGEQVGHPEFPWTAFDHSWGT